MFRVGTGLLGSGSFSEMRVQHQLSGQSASHTSLSESESMRSCALGGMQQWRRQWWYSNFTIPGQKGLIWVAVCAAPSAGAATDEQIQTDRSPLRYLMCLQQHRLCSAGA
jgi:hypothetical protein